MSLELNIDTVPKGLVAKAWGPPMPDAVYLTLNYNQEIALTNEQFCKIVRDYLYVDDSRPKNEGAEFCGNVAPNVSIYQKDCVGIYVDNQLWVIVGPQDFAYLTRYVFTNANLGINDPREQLVNELLTARYAIRPEALELHRWLTTRVVVEGWQQYPHVPGLRRYSL
jgi:hypothetical protein